MLYHRQVASLNGAIHDKSNLPKKKKKLRMLSDPHLNSKLSPSFFSIVFIHKEVRLYLIS
jgi:hypothetical protein